MTTNDGVEWVRHLTDKRLAQLITMQKHDMLVADRTMREDEHRLKILREEKARREWEQQCNTQR